MDRILSPTQVARNAPAGVPELIHRAYVKKEISQQDYFEQTSMWIAENVHQYRPKLYPTSGQIITQYIQRRLRGQGARDSSTSALLGEWIMAVIRTYRDNQADESLLRWAADKLGEVNRRGIDVTSKINRLLHGAGLFENVTPLYGEFKDALTVQEKDTSDRVRGGA